jgi:hypothetical protein
LRTSTRGQTLGFGPSGCTLRTLPRSFIAPGQAGS